VALKLAQTCVTRQNSYISYVLNYSSQYDFISIGPGGPTYITDATEARRQNTYLVRDSTCCYYTLAATQLNQPRRRCHGIINYI
jgi:hypothetical protein